jgi:hypothetical protein
VLCPRAPTVQIGNIEIGKKIGHAFLRQYFFGRQMLFRIFKPVASKPIRSFNNKPMRITSGP